MVSASTLLLNLVQLFSCKPVASLPQQQSIVCLSDNSLKLFDESLRKYPNDCLLNKLIFLIFSYFIIFLLPYLYTYSHQIYFSSGISVVPTKCLVSSLYGMPWIQRHPQNISLLYMKEKNPHIQWQSFSSLTRTLSNGF